MSEIRCPKCGSEDVEFMYTEPAYGDWWRCRKCGEEFPGDEEKYREFMEWVKEIHLMKSDVDE